MQLSEKFIDAFYDDPWKRYAIQLIEMQIISNDALCIRHNCTIHELVVVWVGNDETESKMCIHSQGVARPENCLNKHSTYKRRSVAPNNLLVFFENVRSNAKVIFPVKERAPNTIISSLARN